MPNVRARKYRFAPPMFRAVDETSARRKQIVEQIRGAIVAMRLLPGDRLIEREVCEQMAVSRSLVREALFELEAAGLVEAIPYAGLIVARIDAEAARDVYAIRIELEAFAGRLCAGTARPADRVALRAALRGVKDAYDSGSTAAWLPAKERFYDALLAASGNAALAPMLRHIHDRITILRAMALAEPGRSKQSYRELRAIVSAIVARDPERAATACREHVENAAAAALTALARG